MDFDNYSRRFNKSQKERRDAASKILESEKNKKVAANVLAESVQAQIRAKQLSKQKDEDARQNGSIVFKSELTVCFDERVACDRIILPASALQDLITQTTSTDHVYLFKLQPREGRVTHCGVSEFTADEGTVRISRRLYKQLNMSDTNHKIIIYHAHLPNGTYCKLKPLSDGFSKLNIDIGSFMEEQLKHHSALTRGDKLTISYASDDYDFIVQEIKPEDAVSLINTDIVVDIDSPTMRVPYNKEVVSTLHDSEETILCIVCIPGGKRVECRFNSDTSLNNLFNFVKNYEEKDFELVCRQPSLNLTIENSMNESFKSMSMTECKYLFFLKYVP
eukprot:GHVL01044246.1.p1 GENE.GHVL01044246.1~~GHVL01044246.1.p1  ORF type:complete len:333 (+),score=56.90 GHVL01044246.1:337-1335(+)